MPDGSDAITVGLVADTHGLVRPGLFDALAGVALILHAGDVGDGVLTELEAIAPVRAVFGNTDPVGAAALEPELVETVAGVTVHVSHGHEVGVPTPAKLLARYTEDILVYGHTHRALVVRADGRLVINPGAAGPQRFDVVPSIARLTISAGRTSVEIVRLV